MSLTNREKIIAIISNGITLYSINQEKDNMPNTNMYDFILKITPKDLKSETSAELIDEIFHYVSITHSS